MQDALDLLAPAVMRELAGREVDGEVVQKLIILQAKVGVEQWDLLQLLLTVAHTKIAGQVRVVRTAGVGLQREKYPRKPFKGLRVSSVPPTIWGLECVD